MQEDHACNGMVVNDSSYCHIVVQIVPAGKYEKTCALASSEIGRQISVDLCNIKI